MTWHDMTHQMRTLIGTTACLLVVSALLFAEVQGSLDAGRARDLLRHLGGGELPKDQVRIKRLLPGLTGSEMVVEAQIETAFRFARTDVGWQPVEIRLGDRQWESLELVAEAVRHEKIRRTTDLMQQLAAGLEAYKNAHGSHIVTDDFLKVLDQLPPQFATRRNDLWGSQLSYRGTASGYQLISAGPDQQSGTADDLLMENGAMRSVAQ